MPISSKELMETYELASMGSSEYGEHHAYLGRESGKIYWHSEFSDLEEVALARDHDDGSVRESSPHPMQLAEAVENRGIGRSYRVKQVAGNHDQVGLLLQQVVHRPLEHLRDIDLALIRTLGRLPVELAEPEVQVGEVREFHCKRIVV